MFRWVPTASRLSTRLRYSDAEGKRIAAIEAPLAEAAQRLVFGDDALIPADVRQTPERHIGHAGHVAQCQVGNDDITGCRRPQLPRIDSGHAVQRRVEEVAGPGGAAVNHVLAAACRDDRVIARVVDDLDPIERLVRGADAQNGPEAALQRWDAGERSGLYLDVSGTQGVGNLPFVAQVPAEYGLHVFLLQRVVGHVVHGRVVAEAVEARGTAAVVHDAGIESERVVA